MSNCSGKEAMLLMQSLNKLDTPEQKLETIIKKHADLVSNGKIQALLPRLIWWTSDEFVCVCVSPAGGASQWPEADEDSAKEAAPSDEGEGPAAERAQPGGAGSQQTGGALQGAAKAQQDLKGPSLMTSSRNIQA